MSTICVKIGVR